MPFQIGKFKSLEPSASPAGMNPAQRKGYEIFKISDCTDLKVPETAYDSFVCLSVGQRCNSLEDSRQQGASLSRFLKLALGEDFSLCLDLNLSEIRKSSSCGENHLAIAAFKLQHKKSKAINQADYNK